MKKFSAVFFAIFLILVGLYITGCAKTEKTPPKSQTPKQQGQTSKPKPKPVPPKEALKNPGDFFPAAVGSTWDYQGEGNEYAAFTRKVLFAEGNRAQFREDTGGTVAASVMEITYAAVTRVFFKGEAYDEKTSYLGQETADKKVLIKGPIKKGTAWKDQNEDREIIDTAADVETPAGKFNGCLKIQIKGQDSTSYEYYKEGVGLVKREFKSGETTISSSLKKYEIK